MKRPLTVALLLWIVWLPARARADDESMHRHDAMWYAGWSLIGGGGGATFAGAALTTQPNDRDGMPQPGLAPAATAGWVMVAVGTATWIGGAVLLKLDGRKTYRARVAFDWRSAALRF